MTYLWPQGEPVEVQLGPQAAPQAFAWRGVWHPVEAVVNRWRVHADWWTSEAWQEYVKLTTADGLLCVLAHDLRQDTWRLVRVYD